MNITVHIERLILDGLPAHATDGSVIRAVVEKELARLLATQGPSPSISGSVPHPSRDIIQLANESQPTHLGRRIAQAIEGKLMLAQRPARSSVVIRGASR